MGSEILAYLAGVLKGDGWIYRDKRKGRSPCFCLQTTTGKFSNNVFQASKSLGFNPIVKEYNRRQKWGKYEWDCHYYFVRTTIPENIANLLENFNPSTKEEKKGFIKGIFHSEGSVRRKIYNQVEYHAVRIFNKDVKLLEGVKEMICDFGVEMKLYQWSKESCIAVQTKEGFLRFLEVFGNKFDYGYV